MTAKEEELVNSQIRKAEKYADAVAPVLSGTDEEKAAWTRAYHEEMNRLTVAMGLRVILTPGMPIPVNEQPLVELKDIARYLKRSPVVARTILEKINAPFIEAYKPTLAIFPSQLNEALVKSVEMV